MYLAKVALHDGNGLDKMTHTRMIESLDQLTEWVVDKFSHVKNKNIPVPEFDGHPLTANELKVSVYNG